MVFLGGPPSGSMGYHNPTAPNKYTKKKKDDKDDKDNKEDKEEKDKEADVETKKKKDKPETITEHNTRLNALLYHTSNETVAMYRQENNSSDLLGRLYYDEYDSESGVTSPILSGTGTPSGAEFMDHSNFVMNSCSLNSINSTLLNSRSTGGGLSSSNIAGSRPHIDRSTSPNNNHHFASMSPMRSSSSSNLSALRPALLKVNSFDKSIRPSLSRLQSASSTSSFQKGISFDASLDDHRMSITYKVKHPQFKFRRNNKTFLAGFNDDQESFKAIEWLFDEMVIHGDTITVFQALDEKKYDAINKPKVKQLLAKIEQLNKHIKKVSLVFEVVIGKPQKLLKKAIEEYNPAMMIIGTHHHEDYKKEHKSFLSKSSFSKYFLECALVPVIVVKPTYTYVEQLENPITTETFFEDWMKNINYDNLTTKEKRRSKLNLLSPTSSRNSSHTNLSSLHEDRGRRDHSLLADDEAKDRSSSSSRSRSRSTSKSRGFAKFFHHR